MILLCVTLVNSIIDRKGLYFGNKIVQHFYQKYVQDLKNSKSPVPGKENERLIKYYLGAASDSSIYLLGSSRSFLINQTFLKEQVITNLAVSGASFEDFLLILGMLLQKENVPQKIYLVIDPWFFSKNADIRYLELLDFYKKSLSCFNFIYEVSNNDLLEEKAIHIFNKNYFYYNLSSLWPQKTDDNLLLWADQSYNADGTLNYSNEYEKNASSINLHTKELKFKHKLEFIELVPAVVEKFHEAIRISKLKGIKFIFIILPYHPSINKKQYVNIKNKLILFYDALKQISKDLEIPLYGNIMPDQYNLKNEDYYDGIHLRKSGISKVLHPK